MRRQILIAHLFEIRPPLVVQVSLSIVKVMYRERIHA